MLSSDGNDRRLANLQPKKIAIFRALQLGDLLCAVPALRALRAAFPHSEITLIGLPWAYAFAERFRHYVDRFVEFPGWPGMSEHAWNAEHCWSFVSAMRAKKFDVVLQMHGDGTLTNSIVAMLGADITAGYYTPSGYQPDAKWFMPFPRQEPEIHRHLKLMNFLGVAARGEELEFPIFEGDYAEFTRLRIDAGLQHGNYACIHPGAQLASRRWMPERFAAVGDALARHGLQIVLTGTSSEKKITQSVARHMHARVVDLAGRTNLGTLAVLLARARLLVANDTGVSHIAAALKTPSVIIAGGSDISRWAPLDKRLHHVLAYPVACRPCAYNECPIEHACARGVSTERVQRAISEISVFNTTPSYKELAVCSV